MGQYCADVGIMRPSLPMEPACCFGWAAGGWGDNGGERVGSERGAGCGVGGWLEEDRYGGGGGRLMSGTGITGRERDRGS